MSNTYAPIRPNALLPCMWLLDGFWLLRYFIRRSFDKFTGDLDLNLPFKERLSLLSSFIISSPETFLGGVGRLS
jgi:hypothetical protein